VNQVSGKRVLVTGGAGFLGKRIVDRLSLRNPEDIIVPRSYEWDLTSQKETEEMIGEFLPDIIIHAAAEVGGIGANMQSPGRFLYANAMMGLNVIEEARKFPTVEKIVLVGTVCSYPKYATPPFKEEDIWNGYPEETNAPYGVAKKLLLVQAQAYRQQYGTNIIYLIPTNLYGPMDNDNPETSHVIPAIMRKFIEAKQSGAGEVSLWGSGSASREFLYVDDAAEAIAKAAAYYSSDLPLNLGRGEEISIANLAEKIRGIVGYTGQIAWDRSKPDGQPRRSVNAQRANDLLGWKPAISLDEGLARTYVSMR
jgi:GDP-L-fucose synthase